MAWRDAVVSTCAGVFCSADGTEGTYLQEVLSFGGPHRSGGTLMKRGQTNFVCSSLIFTFLYIHTLTQVLVVQLSATLMARAYHRLR